MIDAQTKGELPTLLRLGRLLAVRLPSLTDTLQNLFTVLVELELCDFDLAGCDADGDALAVALLP